MSDLSPAIAAGEPRPGRWPMWLGFACLALAVAPYLSRSLSAWRAESVLRKTVADFFEAISLGRKDAALALLSDEYRNAILIGGGSSWNQPWEPTGETSSRVLSVRQSSSAAEVCLAITRQGFSLKPTVHLSRLTDASWRITRIEGIDVDPRWTRWKAREAQEAEEALADEITERLTGALRE